MIFWLVGVEMRSLDRRAMSLGGAWIEGKLSSSNAQIAMKQVTGKGSRSISVTTEFVSSTKLTRSSH